MFRRLGPWCHDRRRLVLILWIAALIVGNSLAGAIGQNYRADFSLPGAESTEGLDILKEGFGGEGTGYAGTIVWKTERGVNDSEVQTAMQAYLKEIAGLKGVMRVQSPYDQGNEQQIASQGPNAQKVAYANIELPQDIEFPEATKISKAIEEKTPKIAGLQVERGGYILAEYEQPNTEAFGVAFAIVILIVAFGSVLAMGLPIGIALFGIGMGSAAVILLSRIMQVPDFAPFIGVMIGLGVGIDYALLIVTRYREGLHHGHTVRDSIEVALDTAGRSVVFAGVTVVISLLGMLLMGVNFVKGMAVAAAITVLFTVAASVTLLPALLGFAGEKIERTRWRGLVAAGFLALAMVGYGLTITPLLIGFPLALLTLVAGFFVPALKREVPHRAPRADHRETLAYRWSRLIQRRPWTAFLAGVISLAVVALPVLGLRMAFSDESNFPEDTTTKKAYNLLVDGFGEGFNGPLIMTARTPGGADVTKLAAVTDAVSQDPEVQFASPPQPNQAGNAVRWFVVPKHGPQDKSTSDLVLRLRRTVLPPVETSTGTQISVTGVVASQIDFSDVLTARMPFFLGAVLALSFLFLMIVFRSLLVPLKAVAMNLLSIGASYGIVVALFQYGWLGDVTGVAPGPIEPWAPMMLFAIVFGLSMDYEVFLLSRIREEWHRTGDSHESVADGLAATAKVITAAAAIMVVVFGAFMLERDRTTKLMGTGLAVAILLDATIVRMLLVPATMELLGDKNWWLPRWLDKLLPQIDVEGKTEAVLDEEEAAAVG